MAKAAPKKSANRSPAAKAIDEKIASLADWRGETLAKIRAIILDAVPDVMRRR